MSKRRGWVVGKRTLVPASTWMTYARSTSSSSLRAVAAMRRFGGFNACDTRPIAGRLRKGGCYVMHCSTRPRLRPLILVCRTRPCWYTVGCIHYLLYLSCISDVSMQSSTLGGTRRSSERPSQTQDCTETKGKSISIYLKFIGSIVLGHSAITRKSWGL